MILPVETLVTFFTVSVILALAPGPDNIFVLTQSALHGKTSGLWVTLGLCTGLIVHTTAVALGVAVIFQVSAVAFILATVLIFGSVALLAGTIGEWLNTSSKAQLVLNRVAGVVFVGLALKLMTTQR